MCTAKRKNKLWFIDLLLRTNDIEFTRKIIWYKWLQPFHLGCLPNTYFPQTVLYDFLDRLPLRANSPFLLDEAKYSQQYNYLTYRFFAIVVFHIWNCPLENVTRFGGFGNPKLGKAWLREFHPMHKRRQSMENQSNYRNAWLLALYLEETIVAWNWVTDLKSDWFMALFARIVICKTNKHVPQSLFHKESLSKVWPQSPVFVNNRKRKQWESHRREAKRTWS